MFYALDPHEIDRLLYLRMLYIKATFNENKRAALSSGSTLYLARYA